MAEILRGYTTELDPTNKQRTAFLRHAGAARFAYNWGLAESNAAYARGDKRPTVFDLGKKLNAIKKTHFPWMYEVSKCATEGALRDLDKAFQHFFRRAKLKKAGQFRGKAGFPRFKRRSTGIGSFHLYGSITVAERYIKLPVIGKVRLQERGYLPSNVSAVSATVRERAGRWFVSVLVREKIHIEPAAGPVIGVDLGIKSMAVVSDGRVFNNPKALRKAQKRLARLQRSMSRKVKGSNNRRKAKAALARAHYRVANIRKDALHKATSALVAKTKPSHERPSAIVIEDLNVAGMVKNHKLAQAISDVGMGEFRRQLTYKAEQAGVTLVVADRFYPSSKRCSACGNVRASLDLGERTYVCEVEACGFTLDRDLNAALNLAALATTASSAESNACGETVRPGLSRRVSVKQEPDSGLAA